MTFEEIRRLTDKQLFDLSLKKDKKGNATREACMAYEERRERAGGHVMSKVARCNKFQADMDYYGSYWE
mgnify:CR=1 FL=1